MMVFARPFSNRKQHYSAQAGRAGLKRTLDGQVGEIRRGTPESELCAQLYNADGNVSICQHPNPRLFASHYSVRKRATLGGHQGGAHLESERSSNEFWLSQLKEH